MKAKCACGCGQALEVYWISVGDKLFADITHYAKWSEAQEKGSKRFEASK